MINIDERTITDAVVQSFATCPDLRLRVILTSLVQHLHDFAREVKLTEAEWLAGIQFLTDAGHITDAKRQEFILLSDTLGLSTLVTAQNNQRPAGCTEATVFGPFFVEGAPEVANGADIANGAKGLPCYVRGSVKGLDGLPIFEATIDVWQSDDDGFYDVQHSDLEQHQARARLKNRSDGTFDFRSIVAVPYQIPKDGPVGKMLDATGRHAWRPAHLHFMIAAPGYERLITHVFRSDGPYLESDAVFGVRSTLIAEWQRHEPGMAPDGAVLEVSFFTLDYAFVLNRSIGTASR
jgi:hydroxyquinol 1,2-dioxygenase